MKRALLLVCLWASAQAATGVAVPELTAFDDFVTALMAKWKIPGAALGVSHAGRLVLARGYGMGDVEAGLPVQPDSLFRIASISKTITSAAILKLVEDGKVSLDDKAFTILTGFAAPADARVTGITVRQLLQMTGGWNRDTTFDPMLDSAKVAQGLGQATPVSCTDTIRYMLTRQLDFAPGTQDVYSNYGYCLLGRIIEKLSGQTYESYAKGAVLAPLGITRMQIGHSTLDGRAAGEVRYYDYPGAPLVKSIFPNAGTVARPYGTFYLETCDSLGGWIASVFDLLRFANPLDGRRPPMFLKQTSLQSMLARPAPPVAVGSSTYTGLAWVVQPMGGEGNWYHFGGLSGTSTYILHQAFTGVDLVVLFNSRPSDSDTFQTEVSTGLAQVASGIASWPSTDLFVTGPEIFTRDILNAASYGGGAVTPGEIATLFPSNAGPTALAGLQLGPGGKVSTSIGATRVLFDNIAAPMIYSVAGVVSAIVPYEVFNQATTQVAVEYQGVRSPTVTVPVAASLPGIFTLDASGKGQAAMLNEAGCCNSASKPAARGAVAVLYATGEGQTMPAGNDGNVSVYSNLDDYPRPLLRVSVTVGGFPADILYAGAAPYAVAGLMQVNFRVPAGASVGNAVPVVLTVGTVRSPDGVTMAVQ